MFFSIYEGIVKSRSAINAAFLTLTGIDCEQYRMIIFIWKAGLILC